MSKFSLTSARLGLLQPKFSSLAVVICTVVAQDQYLRCPKEGRNLLLQTFFHWRGTSVVLRAEESCETYSKRTTMGDGTELLTRREGCDTFNGPQRRLRKQQNRFYYH